MRKKLITGLLALALIVAGGLIFQGDTSAASLTTTAYINVNALLTNVSGPITASAPMNLKNTVALANGVAANQADKIYATTASIASAGTLSIDVNGGGLTDVMGGAFNLAKLKLVYIESCGTVDTSRGCTAANTTNLTLFGDVNQPPILPCTGAGCATATTTMVLAPGGVFYVARPDLAAFTVTAGTGDIVKIVNGSGATAYVQIVLVGTSS